MYRLSSSWSLLAVAAAMLIVAAIKLWTGDDRANAPALILLGAGLLLLGVWTGVELVRWVLTGENRPPGTDD